MNKLKKYVPSSISLSLACAMAFGGSYNLSAKETLNGANLEVADGLSNGSSEKIAGFAQYIPIDTDLFFNISKTEDMLQYLRKSQMGDLLAKLLKEEGNDIDEILENPKFKEFLNVVGEEVFFSLGEGSGKLIKSTGDMYGVYYQSYYAGIAKFLLSMYEGNSSADELEMMQNMFGGIMEPMLDELLKMDDFKMITTYVGFKVSDDDERKKYLQIIRDALKNASAINEFIPGMEIPFEPDRTDAYGGFEGVSIDYNIWLDRILESPEFKETFTLMGLTGENLKKYKEKFKDFSISVLVGEVDGYIVIYLGDGSKGLKFAKDSKDSLLANEELDFLKDYRGKEVASISYVSKDITEGYRSVSTYMEDFAGGVNKVLTGTDSLGDTKHIQTLLTKIAKNSRKSEELVPAYRFGSIGYIEDGFKIDSFHGSESALYNLSAKRKFSKIAMRENAVFSASWVNKKEASKLNIQRIEDFVSLIFETTKMVVEHDQEIEDRDFQEFATMFRIFDTQFSDDLQGIWNSAKTGLEQGMGNEGAILIDLEGEMPSLPNVPPVVIENGRIPRLAIGRDIVSREKMAESWRGMNAGGVKIARKAEQLLGQELNYRTPELAKKKGIDFWSYQLGVTSHQANLAVGINDNLAFVTTSPAFVESFIAEYRAEGKKEGADFSIKTAPVRDLAKHWLKLIDDKGVEMSESFDKDDYQEDKVIIDQWLKASEELESIDYSIRKIDGEVRSFFHLNKSN